MWCVPTSWGEDTGFLKRQSLYALRRTQDGYEASAIFTEITGYVYKIKGYGDSRKAAKDDCRRRAKSSHQYILFFGVVFPNTEIVKDFELIYSPPGAPSVVG